MFTKFILTFLLLFSAFLYTSCGELQNSSSNNSEDNLAIEESENDSSEGGNTGETGGNSGNTDPEGEGNEGGTQGEAGKPNPITKPDPSIAIGTTATIVPAYDGNLYTAVYYSPASTSSLGSQSVTLTAIKGSNFNSYYTPSFFALYSSSLPENIYSDAQFLERIKVQQEVDSVLRSPLEILPSEDNSGIPTAYFALTTAPALNSTWKVYVSRSGPGTAQTQITATLKVISQYAYFYVENGVNVTQSILQEIADTFDRDYPKFVEAYAEPGDTDNNGKVTFLIQNMNSSVQSLMGYFFTADQLPANTNFANGIKSNAADVLYINSYYTTDAQWNARKDHVVELFFHELQHMVLHYNVAVNSKGSASAGYNDAMNFIKWINEGLSMLSGYNTGHAVSHKDYVRNFLLNRMGNKIIENNNIEYGYNLLFLKYIQERFGKGIIKKLYQTKEKTEDAIFRDITKSEDNPEGYSFSTLYSDFVKALLMSGRGVTNDPRYDLQAFYYPEGSEGYNLNGFNIRDEINFAIALHGKQPYSDGKIYSVNGLTLKPNIYFPTSTSLNVNLQPYSFYISRWGSHLSSLKSSNANVQAVVITTDAGY